MDTPANQPWSDAIAAALVLGSGIRESGGWCGRWPVQGAMEEHSGAFSGCHFQQAVRQGSAGTFGICSYQQERSALQSLQGEGAEPVRKQGSMSGSRKNWKTGLIHLNTSRGALALFYTYNQAYGVIRVLKY